MRILGLDLGTKTCGISISDKTNIIATPLETIKFKENDYNFLSEYLTKIISEENITDVVIGKPQNMDGSSGFATKRSDEIMPVLKKMKVKVHYIDERLTTIQAQKILHNVGKDVKKSKKIIDTVSACLILEAFLKRGNFNEK